MSSAKQRFEGKVVLVTGAGGGLGHVQAKMFANEGATVVLTDVSTVKAAATVEAILASGGNAAFKMLDVSSPPGWVDLVESIEEDYGKLHVLVNNAGITSRVGVSTLALGEWQRVIDINLTGPMLGIQAVGPLIRKSGGGSIVNIASTAAMIGHRGIAYSASKWGLRGITVSAALEYLDWNIRVNSVHPAQMSDTQIVASATPGYRYANERAVPMKRMARPQEVGNAVLFLASDEASYVNATDLVVDGGAVSIGHAYVRSVLERDFNQSQKFD